MPKADNFLEGSAKLDLIFNCNFFEVADEDFDTRVPAAGNRQPDAFDPPDCRLHVGRVQTQWLDPGVGLGENEDDFFGRKRTELSIQQTDRKLPAIPAHRLDLQI